MAWTFSVSRPVAMAAGSVDDCVLKYAPYGQPSRHALRNWQRPRVPSGWVRLATRPGMIRRVPSNCFASRPASAVSTTFSGIAGWNCPSGSCGRPSIEPLMPACRSTWSYHGAMSA